MTELQRMVLAYLYATKYPASLGAIHDNVGISMYSPDAQEEYRVAIGDLIGRNLVVQPRPGNRSYTLTPAGRELFDHIGE